MIPSMTQHAEAFLGYLKFEKRYSAHTILSYTTDLDAFLQFLQDNYGDLSPAEIGHTYVRSWLASMKEKGLEARSINRKISTLRSFFKYCLKAGVILNSPMGKIPALKTGRKLPVFLKEEETAALIGTLQTSAEDWRSLNAAMLVSIFYATGMRLSELIQLKEGQVDHGRKQVKVLGKGNKERIIPVSPEISEMVKEYIAHKRKKFEEVSPTLLVTEKGKKLYPKYAWILVNDYLGRASTLEQKSPHILRHSFATHLMNNGASLTAVKELLGHSSLAATQVYTHNTIEKLRDIHKKAHPKG